MKQDDANAELEKRMELTLLYDFYGALLKKNVGDMFEAYICDDCSLSEIAAMQNITRQGVHDAVKRCSKQLYEYEEKLGLVKKFRSHKAIGEEIASLVRKIQIPEYQEQLQRILELTVQLTED